MWQKPMSTKPSVRWDAVTRELNPRSMDPDQVTTNEVPNDQTGTARIVVAEVAISPDRDPTPQEHRGTTPLCQVNRLLKS